MEMKNQMAKETKYNDFPDSMSCNIKDFENQVIGIDSYVTTENEPKPDGSVFRVTVMQTDKGEISTTSNVIADQLGKNQEHLPYRAKIVKVKRYWKLEKA